MFESSYVPFFKTFPLLGQLSDEEIKYEKQNMNVATCFMRLPPGIFQQNYVEHLKKQIALKLHVPTLDLLQGQEYSVWTRKM